MKRALMTVAIIMALSFIPSGAWAAPGDTATDPIFISSAEDLAGIRTGQYRYYKLANDIDLTSYLSIRPRGWQPIGTSPTYNYCFYGELDGGGHTISGLWMNQVEYTGLFGFAGDVTIKNLNVEVAPAGIIGGMYVGALIGTAGMSASIENVNVRTGSVGIRGSGFIGGLIGVQADGSIIRSHFTGNVTGTYHNVGGLVGQQGVSGTITIEGCSSAANITGSDTYIGGLVGYQHGSGTSIIKDSYATGSIVADADNVGGLVGRQEFTGGSIIIERCYATNSVRGNNYVGGLVGSQSASVSSNSDTSDSYATGDVTATGNLAGGLYGYIRVYASSNGRIANSYSTGNVRGIDYTGGLVGYLHNYDGGGAGVRSGDARISNSYSTGNVSGGNYTGGLVGRQEAFGINTGLRNIIENCYATGNVNGNEAGGLVGVQYSRYAPVGCLITNSYAVGNVSGGYAGGLVGQQDTVSSVSKIESSYSTGNVTGNLSSGALVGQQSGASNDVKGGYRWELVTVNGATPADDNPDGIQGGKATSGDFMTKATYTGASWLFNDSVPAVGPWYWDEIGFPKLNIGTEVFPFPWDPFTPQITTITINTQPQATTTVTAGSITGSLSVSASVTPSGTLFYQWYSNTTGSNTGGLPISGATGANFAIPTNLAAGTYYYYCVVSATGAASVASTTARVTVEESTGCSVVMGYGYLALALFSVMPFIIGKRR